MPISLKARLCLMMFLNYVIWGSWYVTIGTYLTATLKFSGTEAGAVFGTTALASMITPFFMGLIADRFLATEKLLAILHLIGAVILYFVTRATSFGAVYALMLLYCLCYFPTIGLTNSLTLRQLTNAGGEFPFIRMFATIGWIVIGLTIGSMGIETTATPFLLAAGVSVVMSLYCLTLPHTPPAGKGQKITAGNLLGLDALVMLKKRPYLVFAVASILACIPLTFYFVVHQRLPERSGRGERGGQDDVGPVFGGRRDAAHAVHLPADHGARRADAGSGLLEPALRTAGLRQSRARGVWMFYLAILLHGFCFDFFFMTGQLYTDQEAPSHLRGTAQGFLTFLTYGVGMFIGSLLAGVALDFFTTSSGGTVSHNWRSFWLVCSGGAAAILILVALFFQTRAKIETKTA